MANYQELRVWQSAMDLAESVYSLTTTFPREEVFGLTSQVRRSAVSIASNIAVGHGRGASRDFHRFLGIARGSLAELETQLVLARRIGYLAINDAETVLTRTRDIDAMLRGLQQSLERAPSS